MGVATLSTQSPIPQTSSTPCGETQLNNGSPTNAWAYLLGHSLTQVKSNARLGPFLNLFGFQQSLKDVNWARYCYCYAAPQIVPKCTGRRLEIRITYLPFSKPTIELYVYTVDRAWKSMFPLVQFDYMSNSDEQYSHGDPRSLDIYAIGMCLLSHSKANTSWSASFIVRTALST